MFRGRSGKTGRGGQAAHPRRGAGIAANIAKLPELLRGEGRRPINSGRLLHRQGITPVGAPRRKPAIAPSPRIGVVRYVAWWNTQCNVFVGIMRAQRIEQTKSDDAPILNLCTCHDVSPRSGSTISLSQSPVAPKIRRPGDDRHLAPHQATEFTQKGPTPKRRAKDQCPCKLPDSSARATNHHEKGPAA